jgi:GT2 family glycosyltransferase
MIVKVIVVTYNGLKWLPKSLASLKNSTINIDVLIIDNNSNDGTQLYVKEHFPGFTLVQSMVNLGFGKANNLGIELAMKANCDYVFLLNQDAYLEPGTIERLINIQKSCPELGVVSPFQYNGDGSDLDYNFKLLINSQENLLESDLSSCIPRLDGNVYSVRFVMAAMWLISSDCLKRVGMFDTTFSHYGEDNDYLNRARFHKFSVGVADCARGYHDREYRSATARKKLEIQYAGMLSILTDINKGYLRVLVVSWYMFFKLLLNGLKSFNFPIMYANLILFGSLMTKFFTIMRRRKINRQPFSVIFESTK